MWKTGKSWLEKLLDRDERTRRKEEKRLEQFQRRAVVVEDVVEVPEIQPTIWVDDFDLDQLIWLGSTADTTHELDWLEEFVVFPWDKAALFSTDYQLLTHIEWVEKLAREDRERERRAEEQRRIRKSADEASELAAVESQKAREEKAAAQAFASRLAQTATLYREHSVQRITQVQQVEQFVSPTPQPIVEVDTTPVVLSPEEEEERKWEEHRRARRAEHEASRQAMLQRQREREEKARVAQKAQAILDAEEAKRVEVFRQERVPTLLRADVKESLPRTCPRCHGSMIIETDWYGAFSTCICCGYVHEAVKNPPIELLESHPYGEPRQRRREPSHGKMRL